MCQQALEIHFWMLIKDACLEKNIFCGFLFSNEMKKKGIFYNSPYAVCSIHASGRMCFDCLKTSTLYDLDYTESQNFAWHYDFLILNQHFTTCNWITKEHLKKYVGKTFCIVTEVTFVGNPIAKCPDFFQHYIVLDPTVVETDKIHAFPRPLVGESKASILQIKNQAGEQSPVIGSFGFATPGKQWHEIVEATQNEFDTAFIRFNICRATHVPPHIQNIEAIRTRCHGLIRKPGIRLEITTHHLSEQQLLDWCAENTVNCFFYKREHLFTAGLAAVTDQAIASKRPLLVTKDPTFRHILVYLKPWPELSLREAIRTTKPIVDRICEEWSAAKFLAKFENLLL